MRIILVKKQSQFPGGAGWGTAWRMRGVGFCTNKANFHVTAGTAVVLGPQTRYIAFGKGSHRQNRAGGASAPNKANFRTDRMGQEPGRRPVPAIGAILRNKANWARDGFRLDVATRRSYDANMLKSTRIVEEQ